METEVNDNVIAGFKLFEMSVVLSGINSNKPSWQSQDKRKLP